MKVGDVRKGWFRADTWKGERHWVFVRAGPRKDTTVCDFLSEVNYRTDYSLKFILKKFDSDMATIVFEDGSTGTYATSFVECYTKVL